MDLTILFIDLSTYLLYVYLQPAITSSFFGIYLDAEIRYQRKPYNSCGFFVGFWFLPFCFGVWNAGGRREKQNLTSLHFARKKHIYANTSVTALHLTKQQRCCEYMKLVSKQQTSRRTLFHLRAAFLLHWLMDRKQT